MASRGRGRGGRGRGGRFGGYEHPAKHAEHANLPEIDLSDMTCNKASDDEEVLRQSTLKFEEFLKTSCYHLEHDAPKKNEQAFEVFEKLEHTHRDEDKKEEKEGDDENEPEEEEAEEEENSDDDYNQNIEFDDDDDDWNQEEEAQEDYYD